MTCVWCRKPLVQRPDESDSNFKTRKACNQVCASKYREAVKSRK